MSSADRSVARRIVVVPRCRFVGVTLCVVWALMNTIVKCFDGHALVACPVIPSAAPVLLLLACVLVCGFAWLALAKRASYRLPRLKTESRKWPQTVSRTPASSV